MHGASLPAFLASSLVLALSPGPGVIYIVTRTIAQGRAAGLSSVAGVACGNALNAAGAAFGLAAIFAVWSGAFIVVKVAGAAYLVWLGSRLWRSASAPDAETALAAVPLVRLWRDGLLVALLNPKTTLFFAAFLPQFMDARRPVLTQAIGLGGLFVLVAAATDAAYALLAATLSPALASRRGAVRIGRRASGASLIVLGLLTATTGPAPAARLHL